jgi:hypothetical protein
MQPGEEFDFLQFDLQDLFSVKRAGTYVVSAHFIGGRADSEARLSAFWFLVAEDK